MTVSYYPYRYSAKYTVGMKEDLMEESMDH